MHMVIINKKGMFMKRSSFVLTGLCSLLLLSGCHTVVQWGKKSFYQGQSVDGQRRKVARYVKTVRVYDQLTTEGIFDVLWLSDEVRTAYADVIAIRQGKTDEARAAFVGRQKEENKHFITFYVLTLSDMPLGTAHSKWAITGNIDGTCIVPLEIKRIDLPPEYKVFFGTRWNAFKTAYQVKFDARDRDNKPRITNLTPFVELKCVAITREVSLIWDLEQLRAKQDADRIRGEQS